MLCFPGSSDVSNPSYRDFKENKSPSIQVPPLDSGFESDNDESHLKPFHKTAPESNFSKLKSFDLQRDGHISGFQPVTPTKSKPHASGDCASNKSSQDSSQKSTKCVTNSPGRVYRMARHSGSGKGKGTGKCSQRGSLVRRSSSASAPLIKSLSSNPKSNLKAWLQLQAAGGSCDIGSKDSSSAQPFHAGDANLLRSKSTTGHPKDKNHNCIAEEERERQDLLLAKKLQAEFDFEARYQLNALRNQEIDGEYSLRVRKRSSRGAQGNRVTGEESRGLQVETSTENTR